MTSHDIERLKAAAFHEVVPAAEPLFREAQKVDKDGNPYTMLWKGWQVVYVCKDRTFCRLGNMTTPEQLARAAAMLIRARAIMQGGA